MSRQAFFRPVVIDSTNDELTVTIGAAGPQLFSIPNGAWSNWVTVLEWIRWELVVNLSANAVVGFMSDGRVSFADQGGLNVTIAWTTPQLGYSLGFTAGVGPASVVTGTYSVDHAWFPPYQFKDQDRFWLEQAQAFAGSKAKDGTLSGTSTGPDVFKRTFSYEHCPSELVMREGAIDESGNEWHAERCFETFIKRSRTATAPTAGMPSVRGFYYVQEFADCGHLCFATDTPLTDAQPDLPETMGSGDVCFDLTVGTPDWYVFGFCDEAGANRPSASVPRARQYYECVLEMTTAPAPEWCDTPHELLPLLITDQSPPTGINTTIYITVPGGNALTVHWGNGQTTAVVCNGFQQTLTKNYGTAGFDGRFVISLEGDWDELTELGSYNQTDLSAYGDTLENFAELIAVADLQLWTTSVSGDISDLAGLTALTVLQANATNVTGNVETLAGLVSMQVLYLHTTTVSGDIAALATMVAITDMQITGTDVGYTTCVHPAAWGQANIGLYENAWTVAEVDQMLIDHDVLAGLLAGTLNISGNNAPHTNPGAAENARASLVVKGKVVAVN